MPIVKLFKNFRLEIFVKFTPVNLGRVPVGAGLKTRKNFWYLQIPLVARGYFKKWAFIITKFEGLFGKKT